MVILNRKSQINNTQIIKRFIRAEQTKKHTTKPVNIPVIFLRPIFLAMFELARFHLTLKSFKLLLKKKIFFDIRTLIEDSIAERVKEWYRQRPPCSSSSDLLDIDSTFLIQDRAAAGYKWLKGYVQKGWKKKKSLKITKKEHYRLPAVFKKDNNARKSLFDFYMRINLRVNSGKRIDRKM